MLDFIEPALSKHLVSFTQALWPVYAKIRYRGLQLTVAEKAIEAFRKTNGQPAIICANHSRAEDAEVLFGLSAVVGEKFHFLTAREVFGNKGTFRAQWLQKLGCFSVERGLADASAFRMMRSLLLKGAKLVVFPEGEITHQNENLLALENGPEHIALSIMNEFEQHDSGKTVFILPLAMKYAYSKDMNQAVTSSLIKIERKLERNAKPGESVRIRVAKAFDLLLGQLEKQYGVKSDKGCHLGERWQLLREGIIEKCMKLLDLRLPSSMTQLRRMHILEIRLSRRAPQGWKGAFAWQPAKSDDMVKNRLCKNHLNLATNLISLGEHSFDHPLKQEEACELISVLELALFGTSSIRKPNKVTISAGSLIDVNDFVQAYRRNKHEGINMLKAKLSQEIVHSLLEIEKNGEQFDAEASNIGWTKRLQRN